MGVYQISERVVSERLSGETVVLNLDTGTYFQLNSSGSLLWTALASCQSGLSVQELGCRLSQHFRVGALEAERDAAELVQTLEELGLVHSDENSND